MCGYIIPSSFHSCSYQHIMFHQILVNQIILISYFVNILPHVIIHFSSSFSIWWHVKPSIWKKSFILTLYSPITHIWNTTTDDHITSYPQMFINRSKLTSNAAVRSVGGCPIPFMRRQSNILKPSPAIVITLIISYLLANYRDRYLYVGQRTNCINIALLHEWQKWRIP